MIDNNLSDEDIDGEEELENSQNSGGFGDVQQKKAPETFEILSKDDVLKELNALTQEVSQTIDYGTGCCSSMLHHFKYNKEKMLEKFFAFEGANSGFFELANLIDPKVIMLPEEIFGECQICADETILTGLYCYDMYCADCWKGHIKSKIKEGLLTFCCMDPECNYFADGDFALQMISNDPEIMTDYENLLTKSFVQNHMYLKWCPGLDCTNAVKVQSINCSAIKCKCMYSYCFKCSNESHEPINCDVLDSWIKDCKEFLCDNENVDWVLAFSKQCPKCKNNIEKNKGCNHMTCRAPGCHHEFCWLCLLDWKNHKEGGTSCNRYQQEAISTLKSAREKRKALEDRYKHYYERYLTHEHSIGLEKTLYGDAKENIDALCGFKAGSSDYLVQAFDVLSGARRTLMFTYTFAFYLVKSNFSEVFEMNQQLLEHHTEDLSELLERRIKVDSGITREEVLRSKISVEFLRNILLEHCYKGTENGEYTFLKLDKNPVIAN